ncbi:kinesin-like protein KIN-14C [Salvia miltiorrhiza]|uniref:kinesin-like protein KIN-14C n=1 Tax=Salvia miltiorrhiza TaxID=226208 RepID=UPI0025AD799B|nr:kinesin-like protein KIN-14C [Salvia miltiorrhiza]
MDDATLAREILQLIDWVMERAAELDLSQELLRRQESICSAQSEQIRRLNEVLAKVKAGNAELAKVKAEIEELAKVKAEMAEGEKIRKKMHETITECDSARPWRTYARGQRAVVDWTAD